MYLVAVGLSHQTAPVELRERFAFTPGKLGPALVELRERPGVGEGVILSTCNRTELYAISECERGRPLVSFLASTGGMSFPDLERHLYHHREAAAVEQLFRVAAGIDSMVVGEYQVLGQVKEALEAAREHESAGPLLGTLFETALSVGKRARTETAIGRGAFSVGGCAVELARQIFGTLGGKHILVIGAGKMSEATARNLISAGASTVFVANRTFQRAQELAAEFSGKAVHLEALPEALKEADIVISSTAAPHPILTEQQVGAAMRARRNAPLFLIDIAVPRDIDPAAAQLDNVYLYDIDDLSSVVAEDASARRREVARVEAIISQETGRFMHWYRSLAAAPAVTALRDKFEQVRRQELERLQRKLAHLSEADRAAIEQMTASLINTLLHDPAVRLKDGVANGRGVEEIEALRRLFALEEGGE